MQQQLIDTLFDVDTIQKQIKEVKSGLSGVMDGLEKVAKEIISINGALKQSL